MQTDSLKFKSLKNASYNVFGYGWALVFSIFITPAIVFSLGLENYGVYIFINTLISLLGLIDLGVSTAATKYIAEYYSTGEDTKLRSFIYSLNTLYLAMGIVGFLFFLLAAFITHTPFFTLFLLAGGIFFINAVNSVYSVIPLAVQRFDISNKIGVVQLTLTQITILLLVLSGFGLKAIFIAQLVFAILFSVVLFIASTRLLSFTQFKYAWNGGEIRRCYRFGLGTTLHTAASSSLTYLDRLLIPLFLGPSQLTYYTLPGSVASKVPGISNTLAGVIFPMASSLSSTGNTEGVERLYIRSFRLITILSASMTFTIIFFADPLMRYWLNEEFARNSSSVLIILAITNFILALSGPLSGFLLGLGKLRFLTLSSVGMAILNVILVLSLTPKYGIIGASWAYLISLIPVVYMLYYTERYVLDLKERSKYYKSLSIKLFITGAVSYVIHFYAILPFVKNFFTLGVAGVFSILLFLMLYKAFGFYEKEDWDDMNSFGKVILAKLPFQKHKNG